MESSKMTTTCVRLKPETLKTLEKIAQDKERKVSELMRIIIQNYVKQYEL